MANYALLTACGRDRPGIVAGIAKVLLDSDCNIEDSQSTRLGPNFACMLAIRMPEGMVGQQLADRFRAVAAELGLWVDIHDLRPEEAGETRSDAPRHVIHVYGADRKGIVHGITRYLADHGINVTNLLTEVVRHEAPLYVMLIEVEVPSYVDTNRLSRELSEIGRQLDVVVSIKPKADARF